MKVKAHLFEYFYAIFLILGCVPSYIYWVDILFSYHYWYLAIHLTLLYCLFRQNQDTWWILFTLAVGMLLVDKFIEANISYACVTTFNIIQWFCYYYGDTSNDHLQLFDWIQTIGYCMQYVLLMWILLKHTRSKYGI
jgi:hypothetical protein